MGAISKRTNNNGEIRYRATVQLGGLPRFSLSFDDYDEACKWLEENEHQFRRDPGKYFAWREELRLRMRRDGVMKEGGIIRPRLKIG